MSVADFGAGAGYYAIALAQKLADTGVVYALDLQEPPLAVLRNRARDLHLHNIRTIRADLNSPGGSHLADGLVDRALLVHILYQSSSRGAMLQEASRILKKGGTLTIVEWDMESPARLGPPQSERLHREKLIERLESMRLKPTKEFRLQDHSFGIILQKQ